MVFNPSIPQPNDFLSQTQKQLLVNYGQINLQYNFDHIPLGFNADADRGKHNKVTFEEQSSDPTTSADDYAIYTKDVSGQPEIP